VKGTCIGTTRVESQPILLKYIILQIIKATFQTRRSDYRQNLQAQMNISREVLHSKTLRNLSMAPHCVNQSSGTRILLLLLGLFAALSSSAFAQTTRDRIDLYFGDWHASSSRIVHGALEERDILTRGDAMNPAKKGAVLRSINSYAYATLAPHAATRTERLEGQQEIYFVQSGKGTAHAGGQSVDLYQNMAILIPAGLDFDLENTSDQPMTMYVINEPTPPGFRPNTSILARDENRLPIASSNGMWAHIVKTLFVTSDGLATLQAVLTVTLDPLTIGKPHPVPGEDTDEIEEVWTALDGISLAMVGNQLRRQMPGMAYLHIPDNKTPHTNINSSEDSQDKFLYFAHYRAHEPRK
jgi:mannose-6-phosphate isomerase-like protein (cupin superfamily)